jgi:hypothetical protein
VVVVVVLNATTVVALPTCYQKRGKKEREGEGKDKKIKLKNNKRGPPCDQTRGLPLVFFEEFCCFSYNLQTPRTWPYLGATPKGVVHEKHVQKPHFC